MELFFIIMVSLGILASCTDYESNNIGKKKIDDTRFIEKIQFENHTYVLLRNRWSSKGDMFLHDPGCNCLKKEIEND